MAAVAERCKEINHHPEWSNVYNEVFIRWTTHHNNRGVMKKDRILATVCDQLAEEYGAEAVEGTASGNLINDAGDAGRECCNTGPQSEKQKIEEEEGDDAKVGSVAGIGGQPS